MSSPIPELENSRFWLFRDKIIIVEAVLNIIVQAIAFASPFFYIKVSKIKEQLVTSKSCFFLTTLVYIVGDIGDCKRVRIHYGRTAIIRVKSPVSHEVHKIICPTTADGNAASERVETTKLKILQSSDGLSTSI